MSVVDGESQTGNEGVNELKHQFFHLSLHPNWITLRSTVGVNKFNHLFEAYSQPAVVAGKATEKDVDETEELDELEKDELEKQKRDQAKIEAYKKKSAKRHVRRYGPK